MPVMEKEKIEKFFKNIFEILHPDEVEMYEKDEDDEF